MKNPPDFVMYVVMVKSPGATGFDPCWGNWGASLDAHARGYARKRDADKHCREFRARYGKKNAYVQQYGPIS
jgi:hypothetical protein